MFDDGFQLGGQGRGQLFAVGKGRDDAFEIQVAAIAAGDIVDIAGGIMQRDNLAHFGIAQHHGIGGGIADGQPDDEIWPAGLADTIDQAARKAGAVFQRPAPLIGAPIAPRGPELIQQGMVGGPDLDPLKAASFGTDGGGNMGVKQFFHLGPTHGVRAVGIVVGWQARGAPMRGKRQVGIAMRADVVELLQNHRACGFDGIGDLAKMRDHGVIGMGIIAPRQHACAVDGDGF